MNQKELLMQKLKISSAEADDVIATDKAIDRGERTEYDLPIEQEKQALKYANSRERKKPFNPNNLKGKSKPKDEQKMNMVREIAEYLERQYGNAEIVNESRELHFQFENNTYAVTLIKKKKGG